MAKIELSTAELDLLVTTLEKQAQRAERSARFWETRVLPATNRTGYLVELAAEAALQRIEAERCRKLLAVLEPILRAEEQEE